MTFEEAAAGAARIVATVRERGFKDGGPSFSDGQIWQAVLDTREWTAFYWDAAAVRLVEQVIEGKTPAEAPQYSS